MKKIVSVQDISCYGQCSLTVALPILSSYGIETAILPSSILSTHTGGFTNYSVFDLTDEMPKIVDNWKRENITFDAIYTGYISDTKQFDTIKNMRFLLNEGGLLIVDPAMADHGKLYKALNDNIVLGMKGLVQEADIIIPNLTEACLLLDIPYKEGFCEEEIHTIIKSLSKLGPETVILTGVSYSEDKIGAVAYSKCTDEFTEFFTTRLSRSYHGTGDIFSSVLVANLVKGNGLLSSLKDACEFVVECITNTIDDPSHGYGVKFETVLSRKKH